MWFRSMSLFRLPAPWAISRETLAEQLARNTFARCASNEPRRVGWIAPRKDGDLVHANDGHWLLALRIEERILPPAVIAEEVVERAEALADAQGYQPGRKALRELKERVIEELLPRAFTRNRTTFVWIDPAQGVLAVDGSRSRAEDVIEALRTCLDDFPLRVIATEQSPCAAMADWLAGNDAPAGFSIDRDCELKAVGEEKATVKYVRHPLTDEDISAEIKAHLAAGKLPTKLALTWDDRISFVLTDQQEITRLTFLDILKEEAEKSSEHAEEQFDADFALMTGELSRFIAALLSALGGEISQDPAAERT